MRFRHGFFCPVILIVFHYKIHTQQQLLENEAIGREMEIHKEGAEYKPKNPKCVKLDNLLLNYVKQHKQEKINDDQYFQLCVTAD